MLADQVADQDVTVLGKITTAFGIKGWVKVYSYTDPVTNILEYRNWLLKIDGQWRNFSLTGSKLQTKGLAVSLQGITDRDQALALRQAEIGVLTSELPEPEEDEYYWFQLEGLKVVTTEGVLLGQVKELF